MAILFCTVCGKPSPDVRTARAHVTRANGSHEDRTGSDPGVIVDANGDPVDPPEQREGEEIGGVRGRTTERRAALAGYINDRGGSPHVIDHREQADRFGVSLSTISRDLAVLRESREIEDVTGPVECGFCGEPHESIRAVKVHVSKRSDDVHRDLDGTDPSAVKPPASTI